MITDQILKIRENALASKRNVYKRLVKQPDFKKEISGKNIILLSEDIIELCNMILRATNNLTGEKHTIIKLSKKKNLNKKEEVKTLKITTGICTSCIRKHTCGRDDLKSCDEFKLPKEEKEEKSIPDCFGSFKRDCKALDLLCQCKHSCEQETKCK
jgi:hypothetical protein